MNDPPPQVIRDVPDLRRRLAEQTLDVRTLDRAGFRRWLDLQMARWHSDPVFLQRARIRDLRRAHPELRALEKACRQAARADAATPQAARLADLDRERDNADKAVAGLTEAIDRADTALRPGLEAKRDGFLAREQAIDAERAALIESSPERQALDRAADKLDAFRTAIGLDREETRLAGLQTGYGRGAGRAGEDFERHAIALTEQYILPELGPEGLHLLRGVRLGAAGVEFDLTVVRRPGGTDEPVVVLAVIEAKRNINDLAHGFLRRQIDLAWLTGGPGYDPADHRSGQFPGGHFDRPAVHWEDGHAFRFGPDSFRRFARDAASGYFLDGLYLVSRAGPVWGMSGAALSRISARVATDEEWDPADDAYVERLSAWCRSLAGRVEAPDVLGLYTESADRARQLLLTGR